MKALVRANTKNVDIGNSAIRAPKPPQIHIFGCLSAEERREIERKMRKERGERY